MASESEAKPESTMEETPDTLPKSPAVITSVPEVIPSVPAVITSVPAGVQKAFSSHLSPKQTELMLDLCSIECGQLHLFEKWDQSKPDKVSPAVLRQMANQIESLDESYPGGLREYIKTAQKLLAGSKAGTNPMDGWAPTIPAGEAFELGTKEYVKTEKVGIKELGSVGFVLVAGGLGERLGYNGAKIGLPTESTTGAKYIQYYCEYIRAIESKSGTKKRLPLCIMVSKDTKAKTAQLLSDNKCFGLKTRQITLVTQGDGVPALADNDAKIVLDENDACKIETKPHGHGDIHSLLYKNGVTKKWEANYGVKWIVMFQDTNGLAFHTLPLMLGVSEKRGFIMNSLTVPRKAKQAIGGIAKLKNSETGEERTINVEYNQLDPMLRGTEEFKDGDINDEKTGYSPFPGNINQLLFRIKEYNEVLERTKGAMPDFVNPKYSDAEKTIFKKPTRLECMMQDFPTVLNADECKKVGFTQVAAELCFSPVKNSVADGAALQEKGSPPGTALTGEADQYAANRIMMRARGCQVEDAEPETYNGVTATVGPCIVLKPDFVCCPGEYNLKFPFPDKVKISSRSTLVVRGPGVVIESLDLDGTLIIDVDRGEEAIVRDLVVKNDGWVREADTETTNELVAMRGFKIVRKDQKNVEVHKDVPPEEQKKEDESDGGSEWGETQETESSGCVIS